MSEEQKKALNTLKEQCYNNMAACKAKLSQWSDVVKLSTDALNIDAKNVKALFRRAQGYAHCNDNELSVADLKAVLAIDANNDAAKKLLASVQARIRQLKEKEKQLFGGLFSKVRLVNEAELASAKKNPPTRPSKKPKAEENSTTNPAVVESMDTKVDDKPPAVEGVHPTAGEN